MQPTEDKVKKKRDGLGFLETKSFFYVYYDLVLCYNTNSGQYIFVDCLALCKKKSPPGNWTHGAGNADTHTHKHSSQLQE